MIYYFSESDALMLVDITLDTEKELDISLQIIRCREQSSGMQHAASSCNVQGQFQSIRNQISTFNVHTAHLLSSLSTKQNYSVSSIKNIFNVSTVVAQSRSRGFQHSCEEFCGKLPSTFIFKVCCPVFIFCDISILYFRI